MKNREMRVYRSRRDIKNVENPLIILQGKWLYDAGFSVGDKLTVICQDGKLIVEKADCIQSDTLIGMVADDKTEYGEGTVC